MSTIPTSVEAFCIYAREDEIWLRKLETHLSLLKRYGLLSLWHDRFILSGTHSAQAINTHLEKASIILLLVSANFFASDYCYGVELQRALERQEANEARVIPILVRPVADWKNTPFAHLQVLPTNAKPIASWRNQDMAFADVTAGIRRVIVEDLPQISSIVPQSSLPKFWNVPYPRNPFFLGRDHELAQIHQQLQTRHTAVPSQPQAISGLGGIGKTQLALEYAYRYHKEYQAILWARAESAEALVSSYVTIASLLLLPERNAEEQDLIVRAVKTWLQSHRTWLLILDNADELALLPKFLPSVPGAHLLLTTRAAAIGRLAYRLEIEILPPEQGALFLLRRAGLIAPDAELIRAFPQDRELAQHISQELGGLPLALDQAGAYLEETGTNLADYWQIYKQYQPRLLQLRGGLVADHPAPITATWSLSFQRIKEKSLTANDLLHICAYLAPDAIPEEVFTIGILSLESTLAPVAADTFLLNQAIEALRAYSLVKRNPMGKTLSIHRLVQIVLQEALEEGERRYWAEQAMLAVNAVFPHAEYCTWSQCERLLSHALFVIQYIDIYKIHKTETVHFFHKIASYLQDRARYSEAEPLFQSALLICEKVRSSNHPDIALALSKVAALYRVQGRYGEAEPLLQRALTIYEKVLGPEHLETIQCINSLGGLYNTQGYYEKAKLLLQRVLELREKIFGQEDIMVAHSLAELAMLYHNQHNYKQEEFFLQRILAIREKILEPMHPDIAQTLNNFAMLYMSQGRYEEAEPLYQRSLVIREYVFGINHTYTAQSLNNMGWMYRLKGMYEQSEIFIQKGLDIWLNVLGVEHTYVASSLNNLAMLYYKQKRYEEAEPLFQRSLVIRERRLGLRHPYTADVLENYALLLRETHQLEQAKLFEERAQSIRTMADPRESDEE